MKLGRLLILLLWLGPSAGFAGEHEGGEAAPKIVKLRFRGNRKTEDEAIRVNLSLQVGEPLNRAQLRDDVRAVWRMGYFEDVRVEAEEVSGGMELTYLLVEKPTLRKIYVSGNAEVGVDKINEVLDLRRDTIFDATKVKRNEEKVRDLYVEKGFYLVDVSSEVKRLSQAEVDVYFYVNEHAKVEVRQISFLGNRAVTADELRGAIGTQEGGWLSFLTSSGTYKEDAFDRDLLLITAFYYDRGYINVKIGKPEIELSGDKQFIYITIPLEEGPQFHIGKIDFKGDLVAPKEEYYRRLTVHTGDTFNRSKLGNDIIKLNDLYKDKGYAYVNITPQTAIDNDARNVDLTFDIQQGVKVFVERINIRGNTKTRDKVIRRELKVAEGELYSQSLLDFSKRRVQALGFFEKVELSTRRGSTDNKIEVNLEVTERPTGTFQIGAGFSSVENFIGQAQVSQNNLFGRGQTLALQAQISSLRQLFSLRFLDPYFLDTSLTFAFSIYNSLLFYPSFNRTARGGDLTWGYLLSDNLRIFGTYKLESVIVAQNPVGFNFGSFAGSGFGGFAQASAGTITNLFRSGFTSSLKGSINYDSRNDRMFPTKGIFASAAAEIASPYIASQSDFWRLTGFTRFYYPLWGPFVFRTNLQADFVASPSSQGVPIYERYFPGGINTIRGYHLLSLGPQVNIQETQDPNAFLVPFNIGGNLQLVSNFEIEFPIFPQVQIKGVVFFDAGNAYNTESKWCSGVGHTSVPSQADPCTLLNGGFSGVFGNLRTSAGFGFRWFSPIGPLRFEWGIPIGKLRNEDPIVFEFTIGNFF